MSNLTVSARGRVLCTIPAASAIYDYRGEFHSLFHTALYCSACGDVWGRILSDNPKAVWVFQQRTCRECVRTGWDAPDAGQFIATAPGGAGFPPEFQNDWPDSLLRWELDSLLHVESLKERIISHEQDVNAAASSNPPRAQPPGPAPTCPSAEPSAASLTLV